MNELRQYLIGGAAAGFTAVLFLAMLPLTLLATAVVMVTGAMGALILRYKLRNSSRRVLFFESILPEFGVPVNSAKKPIEGSYTVLQK